MFPINAMMGSKIIAILLLILLLHISVANGSDHMKGEQLRRKRDIQESSSAHTGTNRDDVAGSSGRLKVTKRFLQTSAEGGSYEYVISTSDLTSSPTFYVDANLASSPISGQDRASLGGSPTSYPSNLPSASPSETPTQLPTKAPILTASEKAYMAANSVVAGVKGNLAQGTTGNSNNLTPPRKSSTGTHATSSPDVKGSKKDNVISAEGANKATRKKKSESSKKSAAKLSAAVEGITATGKSLGGKGGKGSQGGSNSVTGDESGGSVVPSGFEASSGPSGSNLGPGTHPMSSVASAPSPAVVDCSAISESTASTDAPHKKSYQVDSNWILREGADFNQVATNVQSYLQTNVATAIAGCNGRRLQFLPTQSLLSNIQFGKPSMDTSSKFLFLWSCE